MGLVLTVMSIPSTRSGLPEPRSVHIAVLRARSRATSLGELRLIGLRRAQQIKRCMVVVTKRRLQAAPSPVEAM